MIDVGWYLSLVGHRTADEIPGVIERLQACGITAEILDKVLCAPESLLYAPERGGEDWAQEYGGPIGAALLTSELLAYLAHQHHLAALIQHDLVTELVATDSVATVAGHLGTTEAAVSRLLLVPPTSPPTGDIPTEGPTP
ncbi:hypothetical protein CH272_28250 [Rhodococcus sp. 05-340-1]|uniref:hypothetical protein n=1 Tax=unclassified Rhodococcus (in: high G+C Gram-positive bacteria) TaxID=192944 RepID=UPI000B9B6B3D|nr:MULTISPECIES: hypothetical protein [unclassified Rhodococcus (in: high G+C Gram-positive bacteria)]OZC87830.1 hypothetical protein CH254_14895 [Rhodococcus sp. 06-412-2C]OZC96479.1 hypothetical protein CH279_15060 [Rhodococcus sp. 06-412-2B]OZD65273.1 hypothetical protein CH271_19685 [Rhodococcus sp. 05-340-2]OZD69307.1 hypothetical protein CH272_28250 [Rhodococcus sp. 05-340-1]